MRKATPKPKTRITVKADTAKATGAATAKTKPATAATANTKPALPQRAAPPALLGPNLTDITVGIDLGDKKHAICALDASGEILDQRKITNHKESLRRLSQKYPTARIVMEVGLHSPWISRFLKDLGHDVIVANPRKLRAIYTNERKSDECDAEVLRQTRSRRSQVTAPHRPQENKGREFKCRHTAVSWPARPAS